MFDKFFVSLRLQGAARAASGRHIEHERQTLCYLILKIWTIFKSTQIASNGAHADVYISAHEANLYTLGVSFFTCYP